MKPGDFVIRIQPPYMKPMRDVGLVLDVSHMSNTVNVLQNGKPGWGWKHDYRVVEEVQ